MEESKALCEAQASGPECVRYALGSGFGSRLHVVPDGQSALLAVEVRTGQLRGPTAFGNPLVNACRVCVMAHVKLLLCVCIVLGLAMFSCRNSSSSPASATLSKRLAAAKTNAEWGELVFRAMENRELDRDMKLSDVRGVFGPKRSGDEWTDNDAGEAQSDLFVFHEPDEDSPRNQELRAKAARELHAAARPPTGWRVGVLHREGLVVEISLTYYPGK